MSVPELPGSLPFPEGWRWLYEVPEAPDPPGLSPTGTLENDLPIALLSCNLIGADIRAEVGRLVTEHALYTLWFLEHGKRSRLGLQETVALMEYPSDRLLMVYRSWQNFTAVDRLDAPDETLRHHRQTTEATLLTTLQQAAAALRHVRENLPSTN